VRATASEGARVRSRQRCWAYVAWAAAVGLLIVAPEAFGIEASELTRDPAAVASVPPWTGAWSLLGVIGWAVAAGSCLTAGAALHALEPASEAARFLLATGVLLAYMGIDDALLLHDAVLPDYLHVPEPVVILVLGALLLAYGGRFSAQLLAGDRLTLALSVTALGLSAGTDLLELLPIAVEDALKVFGLGLLVVWCCARSYGALIAASAIPHEAAVRRDR
jgi:hypothetical protein